MRTEVFGHPLLEARQIFLLCGMLTLPVFVYIACLIPQASIRFLAWLVTHTTYRVHLFQAENLPERGTGPVGRQPYFVARRPAAGGRFPPSHSVDCFHEPAEQLVVARTGHELWARSRWDAPRRPPGRPSKPPARRYKTANWSVFFPKGASTAQANCNHSRPARWKSHEALRHPSYRSILMNYGGVSLAFTVVVSFGSGRDAGHDESPSGLASHLETVDNIHAVRQAVQNLSAEAVTGRKGRTMLLPQEMMREMSQSHVPLEDRRFHRHAAHRRQPAHALARAAPVVDARSTPGG